MISRWNKCSFNLLNPLQPSVAFLYPLKTSRGYTKATPGCNGLNALSIRSEIWCRYIIIIISGNYLLKLTTKMLMYALDRKLLVHQYLWCLYFLFVFLMRSVQYVQIKKIRSNSIWWGKLFQISELELPKLLVPKATWFRLGIFKLRSYCSLTGFVTVLVKRFL